MRVIRDDGPITLLGDLFRRLLNELLPVVLDFGRGPRACRCRYSMSFRESRAFMLFQDFLRHSTDQIDAALEDELDELRLLKLRGIRADELRLE